MFMEEKYKVSDDKEIICNCCILELDDETCRAKRISRIIL